MEEMKPQDGAVAPEGDATATPEATPEAAPAAEENKEGEATSE